MRRPQASREVEEAHYAFLRDHPAEQWPIKYLYDRLGILDNKTGALLRFNGVVMGFLSVAVFRAIEASGARAPVHHRDAFLIGCAVAFVVLAYAEIESGRIFYLRLDRIVGNDLETYKANFFAVTIAREAIFRRLFWASVIGNSLFMALVLYVIAGALVDLPAAPSASPAPIPPPPPAQMPLVPRVGLI